LKTETRIEIIRFLIERWNLSCSIPSDFSGIPVVNNQQSWFIAYKKDRGEQDVRLLWDLFEQAIDNQIDGQTFDAVLGLKYIRYNITMGLFWISPEQYLNLDKVNRAYLAKNGINIDRLPDYTTYVEYMDRTRTLFKKPFFQISHDAWLQSNEPVTAVPDTLSGTGATKYWLFAPGRGGEHWSEFYSKGIMAIGWDYLGDLREYSSKYDIANAIRDHDDDPKSSKKNNATSCYSFCNEMKLGDVVFAKIGRNRIIGRGTIASDYSFNKKREYFKHMRKVDWHLKGEWTVSDDNRFALKTITDVTKFSKFVSYLDSLLGSHSAAQQTSDNGVPDAESTAYWWLNANPKIWDIVAPPIGTRETYTSHNAQGNKRRVYQYFKQVKPGDLLLGYVASPLRQVVALCKVTKGLHDTAEGEVFEFEKVEQFMEPVALKQLQSVPELEKCEPLMNNQGSLFSLTPNEYKTIRSMIDEQSEVPEQAPTYTIEQCAEATGFPASRIDRWRLAIERKGQAVFYGPPGTGKTFIADHLSCHIVSGSNGFVELIQFHPAYAYEDFMQGIRPDTDEKGNLLFKLTPGRFLSFCKKARHCKGPCVLIIDEINRANLSRVFGELMYLLEYRDRDIPLAGGMQFSIPPNVRVIGTMNTADRSIALVDFALRRRFAFIELSPEYDVLLGFQQKRGFDARGLVTMLREVNTKINDKNFSLGISFFMVDNLVDKLEHIWTMEIETYLEEYFFSQLEAVNSFRWTRIKERVIA
jgi:5-methylcytosine-specific restriction protein B